MHSTHEIEQQAQLAIDHFRCTLWHCFQMVGRVNSGWKTGSILNVITLFTGWGVSHRRTSRSNTEKQRWSFICRFNMQKYRNWMSSTLMMNIPGSSVVMNSWKDLAVEPWVLYTWCRNRKPTSVYAMKVLGPQWRKHENPSDPVSTRISTCSQVGHPNIVRGFYAGSDKETGRHYCVMEYVDGISVQTLLSQRGRLHPGVALRIIWE